MSSLGYQLSNQTVVQCSAGRKIILKDILELFLCCVFCWFCCCCFLIFFKHPGNCLCLVQLLFSGCLLFHFFIKQLERLRSQSAEERGSQWSEMFPFLTYRQFSVLEQGLLMWYLRHPESYCGDKILTVMGWKIVTVLSETL